MPETGSFAVHIYAILNSFPSNGTSLLIFNYVGTNRMKTHSVSFAQLWPDRLRKPKKYKIIHDSCYRKVTRNKTSDFFYDNKKKTFYWDGISHSGSWNWRRFQFVQQKSIVRFVELNFGSRSSSCNSRRVRACVRIQQLEGEYRIIECFEPKKEGERESASARRRERDSPTNLTVSLATVLMTIATQLLSAKYRGEILRRH